eukprot:5777317-Amphidinium_carterae.1
MSAVVPPLYGYAFGQTYRRSDVTDQHGREPTEEFADGWGLETEVPTRSQIQKRHWMRSLEVAMIFEKMLCVSETLQCPSKIAKS